MSWNRRLILLFCLFNLCLCNLGFSQSINIVPAPQKANILPHKFHFSKFIKTRFTEKLDTLHPIIDQLESIKNNIIKFGRELEDKLIWIGDINKDLTLEEYFDRNNLEYPTEVPESYVIYINVDTIIIGARDHAGLLYGLYTLDQIVIDHTDKQVIPGLIINDFPKFKYRAIMDDISRGPLSNMEFLKEQIRRLSYLKINLLSFYIEHVVKTKKHPAFSPKDAITTEEFYELSEFAKPYNIELLGSFQSLGHFRNILNNETYRHLGQTDRMLRPGHAESIRFLQEVYEELIPSFSSEYFNINADEAWDLIRGDLADSAASIGPARLFANHVAPLLQFVSSKGKHPMIWGDMLLSYPDAFQLIPNNTTILTWEYGSLDSFDQWIDPIKKQGFDFWICPGIVNSYRVFPDYEEAFGNVEHFINEGYEKGAKGVMTTIWDDGGGHLFARDWCAVAYAAEQSWNPRRGIKEDFQARFSNLFYQDKEQLLLKAIFKLVELKHTSAMQSLNTAFLEEVILPEPGKKHLLNTGDLDEMNAILFDAKILIGKMNLKPGGFYHNWKRDIQSWKLSIDHLLLQIQTYQVLLRSSESYKNGHISLTISTLKEQMKAWENLQERFERLWIIENRLHWMDEASGVYHSKIESLQSLLKRVEPLVNLNTEELPKAMDIGLEIRSNNRNFFTFWLVSDRFEPGKKKGFDYLADLGGELRARPTPYDWFKYQSPFSDRVDINLVYPDLKESVVYLYSRIESEVDQVAHFKIEFKNYIEIILNGNRLNKLNQPLSRLPLIKGKNHLILKLLVDENISEVGFSLKDLDVRNRKQKYKVIQN